MYYIKKNIFAEFVYEKLSIISLNVIKLWKFQNRTLPVKIEN